MEWGELEVSQKQYEGFEIRWAYKLVCYALLRYSTYENDFLRLILSVTYAVLPCFDSFDSSLSYNLTISLYNSLSLACK